MTIEEHLDELEADMKATLDKIDKDDILPQGDPYDIIYQRLEEAIAAVKIARKEAKTVKAER